MKINRLDIRNFKKFAQQTIDLHPQFTLLIGENGSGKTSLLDALAVALGVWFVKPPDSDLIVSRRWIRRSEIRLVPIQHGDRPLFDEAKGGVAITAYGRIVDRDVIWTREIGAANRRTTNGRAGEAIETIQHAVARVKEGERLLLPVLAYYGEGRTWLPHRRREEPRRGPARRWDALYKCLKKRIRFSDLGNWFAGETIAAFNRGGRYRPGFEVVRRAVLQCVPGADGIWYDGERKEIVLSIDGEAQPFSNLAAGHRMMMAMVADLAIKAVTQNNFLVPPDALTAEDEPLPRVLKETPGVVLIDELDVHLHPRWQRRVPGDLKRTFPQIQFICTSHSPQIIGELKPDEIRLLDEPYVGKPPAHSFALDTNTVLEEVMGAESRTEDGRQFIAAVEETLESGDLQTARKRLDRLRQIQNGETPDTTRLGAMINSLEAAADAER